MTLACRWCERVFAACEEHPGETCESEKLALSYHEDETCSKRPGPGAARFARSVEETLTHTHRTIFTAAEIRKMANDAAREAQGTKTPRP